MSTHLLGLFFLFIWERSQAGKVCSRSRTCLRLECFSLKVRFRCWYRVLPLKNRVAANKPFASPPSSSCCCKCWSSWLREPALRAQRCLSAPWKRVNITSHPNFTQGLWLVAMRKSSALAFLISPKSLTLLLSKIGCMHTYLLVKCSAVISLTGQTFEESENKQAGKAKLKVAKYIFLSISITITQRQSHGSWEEVGQGDTAAVCAGRRWRRNTKWEAAAGRGRKLTIRPSLLEQGKCEQPGRRV